MRGVPTNPVPPEIRFWAKVLPVESGCWEWQSEKDVHGYAMFNMQRKRHIRASRYAYQTFVGNIPEGLFILHSCDNPACVRLDHLRPGTRKDNHQDMMARGRGRNQNSGRTHCRRGHEYTPENTYPQRDGARQCRTCCLDWKMAHRHPDRWKAEQERRLGRAS